jgi:HPt (histidine-containing phosphotransfer) domain-containing protein
VRHPSLQTVAAYDRPSSAATTIPVIDGLDTRQGLARVNGDVATYLRLLKRFRDGQADVVSRIRGALQRGDLAAATREAHTIVGAGGNIGATRLSAAAREVETACRMGLPAEQIPLQRMQGALDTLIGGLGQSLGSAPVAGESLSAVKEAGLIAGPLRELKTRIDEYDATAGDALEVLRARLGTDGRVDRIEQCLGRYDFNAAAAALQSLAADFDIRLETVE